MNPTITMHQPPPDNRPPPPETATLFVVVHAIWFTDFGAPRWYIAGVYERTRDDAEKSAAHLREKGHIIYAIAEITATRGGGD